MSDWPPKPTNQSHHQQENKSNEWDLLEKVVLSSVDEQKKTRKWGIFFKSLTFIYLFIILFFLVKGCSISKDGESEKAVGDHLAVVDIQGTIGSSSKDVNSADTIKALKAAFKATTSKAVVLNINSPGGSPVESNNIWQEIRYLEKEYPDKKVYAVIGDIGASAAYHIASAASEIWVNPSSFVGSIGVIMPNYGVTGLAQKLGVEDRTLTAGTNKDILSMTKPVNPAQKAHVQGVLDDVHQHFIDAVKEGRGDRLKNADPSVFSGLFWSGSQAIKIGIADKSGNIETLKRTLKISKTVNYTVEHNPLESLLGKMGAQVGQGFASSLTKELETKQEINLQ
ncbi:S49 family peptidase [Acinetobacter sp. ESL0695]|uniref:S49 family peptidase n=1 Tax=Acinetobacter sp. ESL0695 TaxID=2983215 RepID=UPI0023F20AD9|nr:S49 family peptidase [Acinetobacter sp. ESL0695]WEV49612.1 S49 family peptidase [Acinetobacter sp. ESL0695]